MLTESEALLRSAAQYAGEEQAAAQAAAGGEDAAQLVVIHVTIKGVGEWTLDTLGDVCEASAPASPQRIAQAKLHLTYASPEVFLGLAHRRLDPRAALFTGKLSFRGEMSLGIRLGTWIRKAVEQGAAAAEDETELEVARRDKWEKDEDATVCLVCGDGFKIYRRRHHCRYCGRVVCDDCSSGKVDGQRACDTCRDRANAGRAARQQALANDAALRRRSGERRTARSAAAGEEEEEEEEEEEVRVLENRVVELEEQVDTLDRRAFTARAAVLRQVVLSVYRGILLLILAFVFLGAHFTALGISRRVGPSLFEVSLDVAPLSAAVNSGRGYLAAAVRGAGIGLLSAEAASSSSTNASSSNSNSENDKKQQVQEGEGGLRCDNCDDGGGGDAGLSECDGDDDHHDPGMMSRDNDDDESEECDANSNRHHRGMCIGCQARQSEEQPGDAKEDDATSPSATAAPAVSRRKLTLSLSVYWTVMFVVVACLWEHLRRTEGLLLRRVRTFCLSGSVIFALKMTRKMTTGMTPVESDETWTDAHKLLAPFVYQSILDLSGMWVKTGQYLSSRADVMPQPYLDELSKLQDAVPASPYEEVEATAVQQLGRPLSELFQSVEREALASASVAQVHRCTLKDGRDAVIKIQHRRVRQLFLEDLRNIRRLINFVAWAEKDYDFRPIMNEWTSEVTKELDFFCEAKNLSRIAAAMKRSGLKIIIPELIPEFTGTKVVVMTFCKGFKVTDAKALAGASLDREAVMQAVTESFAYQIHIDGLFNGDPHPGNILIQAGTKGERDQRGGDGNGDGEGGDGKAAVPVLLDWGLAKTLSERLRVAFSRFVYSASEHDFVSMLASFEEMGVKLNRFDPAEDMHNIRFLLRDTQPSSEAKEDMAKFHRRMRSKKARGLKTPVDAYPGDLLFFLRVTMLLRGLAARLNVRQKYMDIMAPYAKQALRDMVPVAERATEAIYPSPLLSPLEAKVRKVVEALLEAGDITGCQVCVIYRGERLVDLCAGTQGPVDPRPVTPSTLFCVFSAGKAVCAAAIHVLADRGLVRYDQRVAEFWPEFARYGKETTTVRHVLTHSTGLQHVFPDRPTFDTVCDWEGVQRVLQEATPAWEPGSRASYHYFTFGWLVAAVVEKASGVCFEEFVHREIAVPLNLEDSFYMGRLRARGVNDKRVATVEHAFRPPSSSTAAEGGAVGGGGSRVSAGGTEGGSSSSSAGAAAAAAAAVVVDGGNTAPARQGRRRRGGGEANVVGRPPSGPNGVADEGDIVGIEDDDFATTSPDGTTKVGGGGGGGGGRRRGILAMMASALKESDPQEGAAVEGLARKLSGREYFLDPRVFNHRQMREACIPAANGHFTAKALAVMHDSFLESLGLSDGRVRGSSSSSSSSGSGGGPGVTSRSQGTGGTDDDVRVAGAVQEEGRGDTPRGPLLSRSRVNEMRAYQVMERSALHLLFGLPARGVRYALGYQMFGFREAPKTSSVATTSSSNMSSTMSNTGSTSAADGDRPPPSRPRGRVRLSGFGHVGMGGSVALCDPASGLAFAMVTNKVATGRKSSSTVLSLVCRELGIGDPSHFFED